MKKFKLRKASNGYILKYECLDEEIVYQINEEDEVESLIQFLHEIVNLVGLYESKFDHQLKIVWVPGSKNDTGWKKLKKCPVCWKDLDDITEQVTPANQGVCHENDSMEKIPNEKSSQS